MSTLHIRPLRHSAVNLPLEVDGMKMNKTGRILFLLCLMLAGGGVLTFPGHAREIYPVGAMFRSYEDGSRKSWASDGPRPLQTVIWYPAKDGTVMPEQSVAIFKTGKYKTGAEFSEKIARFPLIVVSHGTGGSAAGIAWLCTGLAQAGYIVAAVNHHGNTGAEPKYLLEGFILWWERPADIRALIDSILKDPALEPRIDAGRIGVAGFSIGGYTALATVGARLNMERWKPYCAGNERDPLCHLPPEANYKMEQVWDYLEHNANVRESWPRGKLSFLDSRIRAAFVMAPVTGPLITEESLRSIRVPVKIVVGSADDQSIPSQNAVPFSKSIPQSELEILPGVAHYTFLSEGTWSGKLTAGTFLRDPKGIDRRLVHEKVGQEAAAFFDRQLMK